MYKYPGGRGYSMDVRVGRCGWGAQTLTLFKTEISDFPTLFKTACSFLRPGLNIQYLTKILNSLSSFVVAPASGISANKQGYKFGFCTIFPILSVRPSLLNRLGYPV